jgi:hypothetical protein
MVPASWEGVVNPHPCILKRRYRVWQICHRADEQNALKIVSPPPLRGKQTSSSKKVRESMANEKSPPHPYPNPELKRPRKPQPSPEQGATGFRAPLHSSSLAFPFSLINPTSNASFGSQVNQVPHKPVLWPVKASTLNTDPHISHWHVTGGTKWSLLFQFPHKSQELEIQEEKHFKPSHRTEHLTR